MLKTSKKLLDKRQESEVKNETPADEEVKEDSTKPQLSEEELRDNLKKI